MQVAGIIIFDLVLRRQQVEEQRGQTRIAQHFGDRLITRAPPAAPAAMRKQDEPARVFRNFQIAGKRDLAGWNLQHNHFRGPLHFLLEWRGRNA